MSTPDAAARPAWLSPHAHLWACPGGCGPEIPIHECQPPLALLERTAELEAALAAMVSIFDYADDSGRWFTPGGDGCGWCLEYSVDPGVPELVARGRAALRGAEAEPA